MQNSIEVYDLSKIFFNKKEKIKILALDKISFSVRKGEIFGLLGPNGAGKTTTIRLITGLLTPTTGTIYINGIELFNNAHIFREKMGILTENPGSYEMLSVYENLKFFGSFYKINNLEERIDEILKEFDLYKRKDLKAGKLSKGQKQRLALARTLIHDPEILLLDEPTAGLDPEAAFKVRNLILGLKKENRTIFINSHNLEEVSKVCDRVAILNKGRIRKIGKPEDMSRELWKSQEVIIRLKNKVSKSIEEAIKKIDNVLRFRLEDNEIHFFCYDAIEITPKIVRELVSQGAEIIEVTPVKHSLEEIYLKLIEER
ncbi:MAG: ABC transporter ATP-binding protein [Candidatus Helarchaeota archaeon]